LLEADKHNKKAGKSSRCSESQTILPQLGSLQVVGGGPSPAMTIGH
jgi:hypothetical protein